MKKIPLTVAAALLGGGNVKYNVNATKLNEFNRYIGGDGSPINLA